PSRIDGHRLPFFEHDTAEFFDADLAYEKLDPRRGTIFLFPEPRKNARDGLSKRKEFFFGYESIEKLRLVRNGAQSAANVNFEAAFFFAVFGSRHGDAPHVVHVGKRAGLVAAARESDFEFTPEALCVGMPEHEPRCSLGVWCHVECLSPAHT